MPTIRAGVVPGRRTLDTEYNELITLFTEKRNEPTSRDADRPARWGARRSAARDVGSFGVSPGAGPKPGPRSDRSSTAKHSPEWPTQKPLGPASWLPLPRRVGSAGFPQIRHAAEL